MKPFKGQQVFLGILLVMVFFLAFVVISSAQSKDPLQELYNAAKAEREVVWQWTAPVEAVRPVIDAFHARFPGIKLSVISIGSSTIPSRIITEASTRKLTVDVATCSAMYMAPLLERDLLVKHDWTRIVTGAASSRIVYDGGYINVADAGFMWAYNTKLVSKAEAPKTLEDTLDPKWKGGKISIRAAPTGLVIAWPLWKQDRQKAVEYVKGLVKQDFMPEMRVAVVADRIIRGECLIGMPRIRDVYLAQIKGAPIAPCPIKTALAYPNGVFIPKGGVKHPNAAKLLMAWMLTPEGTEVLIEAGGGILHPPEASKAAKWLDDNGIGVIRIASKEDVDEYNRDFATMVMKETGFKPE